ncbi:MAG TPA: electron transfer flavoprotein subunit alpha, partial [Firmicutes bacterium]|nr:electron transfer flavoprotein subunit alpha [Bacillota bacterium]
FGGNIMAQIITPDARPQFATVRYKVMTPAQQLTIPRGSIENCSVSPDKLKSELILRQVVMKEELPGIS